MKFFNGVVFVRLRSCGRRGKYLAADVDGWNVCITGQRGTHNTVWAVHHAVGPGGSPGIFLRSAYGNYLDVTPYPAGFGPSNGLKVHLGQIYSPSCRKSALWQVIPRGTEVEPTSIFYLQIQSASGVNRCLRANGRYRRWRTGVTAAMSTRSTMYAWAIEEVPVMISRPCILEPIRQLTHRNRPPPTEDEVTRQITYVIADANGNIDEGAVRKMQLCTNNLMHLRVTMACRLGAACHVANTTICIKHGPLAPVKISPLLIDLPISQAATEIVILNHGTQADEELQYPDLDAPVVDLVAPAKYYIS